MIQIQIPNIEEKILFSKERYYHLIIENPIELRNLIYKLREQLDEDTEYLICFDGMKELSFSKIGFLIENPLKVELDDKKVNAFIQKDIPSKITPEQKEEYQMLLLKIREYLESITYDYVFPVSVDDDISLSTFLKTFSISSHQECSNYLEQLLWEIRKINYICGSTIIILLNIYDFLSKEEIMMLITEINKLELSVLLLSGHRPNMKLDNEYQIIIDYDLCELHIESKA